MQAFTVCFGSWPVLFSLCEAHVRVVHSSINSLMLGNRNNSHDVERAGRGMKINARLAKNLYLPCAKPGRDLCTVGTIRR